MPGSPPPSSTSRQGTRTAIGRTAGADRRATRSRLAVGLASDLATRVHRPLLGAGIGSPGVVDPAGIVVEAPNLGWCGLDLAARAGGRAPVPGPRGQRRQRRRPRRTRLRRRHRPQPAARQDRPRRGRRRRHRRSPRGGRPHSRPGRSATSSSTNGVTRAPVGDRLPRDGDRRSRCCRRRLAATAAAPRSWSWRGRRRLGIALAPVVSTLNLRRSCCPVRWTCWTSRFRTAALAHHSDAGRCRRSVRTSTSGSPRSARTTSSSAQRCSCSTRSSASHDQRSAGRADNGRRAERPAPHEYGRTTCDT